MNFNEINLKEEMSGVLLEMKRYGKREVRHEKLYSEHNKRERNIHRALMKARGNIDGYLVKMSERDFILVEIKDGGDKVKHGKYEIEFSYEAKTKEEAVEILLEKERTILVLSI